ncbi:glutamine synthetase family protein [Neobacillus massiliamazoniensis]|uniref:Glutamate--ammonia ligase n=1 Tax=Neobacillus massiliamazoniensis TaxID=1499688 RepID=A0A0U1P040_9BACI|nr:glutamine synthetase family protein [Neobacillus massiliamazoniensis]CRK83606.1 glutamate--ammonia ligase [Neobacillus massiliamazoniensis]
MSNNEVVMDPKIKQAETVEELIRRLEKDDVKFVRLTYSDIHGYPRGKDIPLEFFKSVVEDGQTFCVANLVDGLAGNPLNAPGMAPDRGYPDMRGIPDLSTVVTVPWEPHTVQCLVDLYDDNGDIIDISPRQFLKRAVDLFEKEWQLKTVFAHELEFYLLKKTGDGWERYSNHSSMVYTVGHRSDELGMMHKFLSAGKVLNLGLTAANHEFGAGQFEVNMLHGEAVESSDRAFRFKNMVKEVAACQGLHATFMGKPFNHDAGSGFHIHISLNNDNGNAFYGPNESDGLSRLSKQFLAGILHHAPALMAFLAPTVNAYKRLVPDSLVPLSASWGYDNRTAFVRIPADRRSGSRLEIRAGDASANPYLISAVCLLAGYDGIVRQLEPPIPVSGDVSLEDNLLTCLPKSLEESISNLLQDERLCELIGEPMVNAFTAMKRVEAERFRRYVTDWEFNEYVYHL